MDLKDWELKVLLKFLDMLDDKLSVVGCNDTEDEMIKLIPKNELVSLDKKYHEYNGDPEEHDPDNPRTHLSDFCLLGYIQARLSGKIK